MTGTRHYFASLAELGPGNLDRDQAVEARIAGFVNLAHTPGSEGRKNDIRAEPVVCMASHGPSSLSNSRLTALWEAQTVKLRARERELTIEERRRTPMKRILLTTALVVAGALVAFGQRGPRGGSRGGYSTNSLPTPNSEAEKQVFAVLDEAQRTGSLYLNVPVTDGRMLRLLTEALGAKNVVEIGTSTGLSGLWFSLALQKTGGRLTTFEYDAGRAATARGHFKKAGVDHLVTVVEGDAHQTISRLKEPIDVLFIDADKEGYVDYLNKLLPLVRPGGLIIAHNDDTAPDYQSRVTGNPALETLFYREGSGMAISLRKR
jgi:caffeoyl-CoA O-methyltransferase